ncbi:MAG: ribbon-helix-helix protein, CopG family [Synechococcaceae bacterium WB9_2_112]|nr:ribbon-helix-helix protein, CopG family [Synechococcaceae bacterium WB9_2_112]
MRRITVSVADEMHRALRLLAILEGKSFGAVVLEALDFYLRHKQAYNLDVAQKAKPSS